MTQSPIISTTKDDSGSVNDETKKTDSPTNADDAPEDETNYVSYTIIVIVGIFVGLVLYLLILSAVWSCVGEYVGEYVGAYVAIESSGSIYWIQK